MTRQEWLDIASGIAAKWSQSPPSDATLAQAFHDLGEFPAEQVAVAVEVLYRDGREWPPNGAQIRQKVAELALGMPDHGNAWELAMTAVRKFGSHCEPEALRWLRAEEPAVGEAVRRFGFRDLCLLPETELGTTRAQFREVFKGVVREIQRDASYQGLPDAGFRRLRQSTGPKRIGDVVRKALPERAGS